jgi:L-fucose isomerase-like protein
MEVIVMSNIGIEVLKIALQDAVKRQQLIDDELAQMPLAQMPEQSNVRKLVAEQSHLLEETLTLLNRIA